MKVTRMSAGMELCVLARRGKILNDARLSRDRDVRVDKGI